MVHKSADVILRTSTGLLLALATLGCQLNASITNLRSVDDQNGVETLEKNGAGEFVSGSGQYQTTLIREYRVLSSVGSAQGELTQTTPNGYRVYFTVQGVVVSNEVQR